MTFVPDSKSRSLGYRVRIFQIHNAKTGHSVAVKVRDLKIVLNILILLHIEN